MRVRVPFQYRAGLGDARPLRHRHLLPLMWARVVRVLVVGASDGAMRRARLGPLHGRVGAMTRERVDRYVDIQQRIVTSVLVATDRYWVRIKSKRGL
jgi:hypothetical protein